MSKPTAYRGTVTQVYPGILQIAISDETACDACSAQKSCCMSGAKEKRIDVPFTSGDYRAGDSVTIVGRASMGLWAAVMAFVLPLMLLLLGLFVATSVGVDERQAALLSLAALGAYYLVLYLFRNKFGHIFTFTIQND